MFRFHPRPASIPAVLVESPLLLEPSAPPLSMPPLPHTPRPSLSRAIGEPELEPTIQNRPEPKFNIEKEKEKQKLKNEVKFEAQLRNGQISRREKAIYKKNNGKHTSDRDICNGLLRLIDESPHSRSLVMTTYCKNPMKQNTGENLQHQIQQGDLANTPYQSEKLPTSGTRASYLSNGTLKRNLRRPPKGHNTTKSLDGVIIRDGNAEYLTYLKAQTGAGGSQDLSCADGVNFLTQAVAYATNNPANCIRTKGHVECRTGNKVLCPTTIKFILVVDGTYYTRAKLAMLRGHIPHAVATRVFCMHSYCVGRFVRRS